MAKSPESSTELFDKMFQVSTELNLDPRFVAHATAKSNSIVVNPSTGIEDNIGVSAVYGVDYGGVGFGGTFRSKYTKVYFGKTAGRFNSGGDDYHLGVEDLADPLIANPYAWACSSSEGDSFSFDRGLSLQRGNKGVALNKSHQEILEAKAAEGTIPGLARFALLHGAMFEQKKQWHEYPRPYDEQRRDYRATEQFMRHVGLDSFVITSWIPVDYEGASSLVVEQELLYDQEFDHPNRELRISFDEQEDPEYTQIERASGEKIATINSLDTEKLLRSLQKSAKLLKKDPTAYVFAGEHSNLLVSQRLSVTSQTAGYLNSLPVLR